MKFNGMQYLPHILCYILSMVRLCQCEIVRIQRCPVVYLLTHKWLLYIKTLD